MEQLPQRGNVPQIGVFHTPSLCNIQRYNWTTTTFPEVSLAARLRQFHLLPDQHREALVANASKELLEGVGCTALDDEGVLSCPLTKSTEASERPVGARDWGTASPPIPPRWEWAKTSRRPVANCPGSCRSADGTHRPCRLGIPVS